MHILGNKLSKRDKLGIHKEIESIALEALKDSISAALIPRGEKSIILQKIRRDIETAKHLIRLECEVKIISEKEYIYISRSLEDISMMANGWLKSTTQNSRQS